MRSVECIGESTGYIYPAGAKLCLGEWFWCSGSSGEGALSPGPRASLGGEVLGVLRGCAQVDPRRAPGQGASEERPGRQVGESHPVDRHCTFIESSKFRPVGGSNVAGTLEVIMAGNVVTGEMTEELILSGADVVKVLSARPAWCWGFV